MCKFKSIVSVLNVSYELICRARISLSLSLCLLLVQKTPKDPTSLSLKNVYYSLYTCTRDSRHIDSEIHIMIHNEITMTYVFSPNQKCMIKIKQTHDVRRMNGRRIKIFEFSRTVINYVDVFLTSISRVSR